MLIKMPEKDKITIFRQRVEEYSAKYIIDLFRDKYACEHCPFKLVYTKKIPFGCGNYHRYYCKQKYAFVEYLPWIFGILPKDFTKEVIDKIDADVSDLSIVKPHPNSSGKKKIYCLSVLYIKELNFCPIDEHNTGINPLDPGTQKMLDDYRKKHGLT